VREGRFREDLYYRLAGVELELPALRARSDRPELIHALLVKEGGADARLSPEAERLLLDHSWPGNIRQLAHVLRTAAALADGRTITRAHLPSLVASLAGQGAAGGSSAATARGFAQGHAPAHDSHGLHAAQAPHAPHAEGGADEPAALPKLNPIQANERQLLLQMLEQHRWNVSNVAKALDVSRNTLYRKIHKLQIEVSHPDTGW
jgi:transcriptional regulator of acetoin/glycerol metabolism